MQTGTVGGPPAVRRGRLGPKAVRYLTAWTFVGPVVVGTLLFNVLPMIPTFYYSFTNWNGLEAATFMGLNNYSRALGGADPDFMNSVNGTLKYMVGAIPSGIVFGLILALLVNEKLPAITLGRGLLYLPVISSVVAVGVVWKWLFNWNYGLINAALSVVHINGPRWLTDPNSAMVAVIIVATWSVMGYNMVLFLAALQGVPPSLEEAAEIDGAGVWSRFWRIKLPLITPTIFFVFIMAIIGSFQVFNLIYVMTAGGPGTSTWVYVYNMYMNGFQLRKFGYGCALAWLLFIVVAVVTWGQWKLSERWVFYG